MTIFDFFYIRSLTHLAKPEVELETEKKQGVETNEVFTGAIPYVVCLHTKRRLQHSHEHSSSRHGIHDLWFSLKLWSAPMSQCAMTHQCSHH